MLPPVFLQCHSSSSTSHYYHCASSMGVSAQNSRKEQNKKKQGWLTWVSSTIDRHGYSHQKHASFCCSCTSLSLALSLPVSLASFTSAFSAEENMALALIFALQIFPLLSGQQYSSPIVFRQMEGKQRGQCPQSCFRQGKKQQLSSSTLPSTFPSLSSPTIENSIESYLF